MTEYGALPITQNFERSNAMAVRLVTTSSQGFRRGPCVVLMKEGARTEDSENSGE